MTFYRKFFTCYGICAGNRIAGANCIVTDSCFCAFYGPCWKSVPAGSVVDTSFIIAGKSGHAMWRLFGCAVAGNAGKKGGMGYMGSSSCMMVACRPIILGIAYTMGDFCGKAGSSLKFVVSR